jgi:NAD(P)-dependent dehydrogenase (short-subunit alcohol dehydrogenase family)
MPLKGKTAVVTGSGRGLGKAIALKLASMGANIVLNDIQASDAIDATAEEFRAQGYNVAVTKGDVRKEEDIKEMVRISLEAFGSIDILVNNAGIAPKVRADLLEMSEESFDRVLEVNLKGTMFFTQLVARQMVSQEKKCIKNGTIVNVSSISSVVSSVNRGEYCISKAGISMLTTLFADRLASEGIFVYEVRPGVIATEMTSKVKEKYDKLIEQGLFPIKRWGQPEDIANAVSLLCSDKMTYSTGDHLYLDGGFHIQRL